MKTSELTRFALNWAVAEASGMDVELSYGDCVYWEHIRSSSGQVIYANAVRVVWSPSTNWAQGGLIIEREGIALISPHDDIALWEAYHPTQINDEYYGPTPLIAAMRCYVASKFGDEVEIPEELTEGETQ